MDMETSNSGGPTFAKKMSRQKHKQTKNVRQCWNIANLEHETAIWVMHFVFIVMLS